MQIESVNILRPHRHRRFLCVRLPMEVSSSRLDDAIRQQDRVRNKERRQDRKGVLDFISGLLANQIVRFAVKAYLLSPTIIDLISLTINDLGGASFQALQRAAE